MSTRGANFQMSFSAGPPSQGVVVMSAVMSEPIALTALSNRRAIVEALEAAHEHAVDYWSEYTTAALFSRMGAHWSASEHVRHLTRAMTPLLPVLRVPRVALRMAFGAPTGPSRSLSELQEMYAAVLRAGGTAGRYTPPPDRSAEDMVRRNRIMDTHSETLRGLTQAMERWSEEQLDAHRLPHPLIGKLTVREMMLFTLLHNEHHVTVAERRRLETGLTLA